MRRGEKRREEERREERRTREERRIREERSGEKRREAERREESSGEGSGEGTGEKRRRGEKRMYRGEEGMKINRDSPYFLIRSYVCGCESGCAMPYLTQTHASTLTRRSPRRPPPCPTTLPLRYYTPSDLSLFQTNNNLTVTPIARQIGFNNASNPGVEAQLDTQFLTGVADNVRSHLCTPVIHV